MNNLKAADRLNKIKHGSAPPSADSLEQCNVERVNFETLLTDIVARFVNLPIDKIDAAIKDFQRAICEYIHIDNSMLWQIVKTDPTVVTLSHGHNAQDDWRPSSPFKPGEHIPWFMGQILNGKTVPIGTDKDQPSMKSASVGPKPA